MVDSNQKTSVPKHIAVVMDGNGRWAQLRGFPRVQGHRKGVENVRKIISLCGSSRVEFLTLFAFSSENWRRPPDEVRFLTQLLISSLKSEISKLHRNDIRLEIIGNIEPFGAEVLDLVESARDKTQNNNSLTLTIALNYGARWDISMAVKSIGRKIKTGSIDVDKIDESIISSHLATNFLPEPDLFIRTGGEVRLSNFLLWQLAYTELYFSDVLWPDFNEELFIEALDAYSTRQRRYGKTGEQVNSAAG